MSAAAGILPATAPFIAALLVVSTRERRRRRELNRALHELRRPLQVLALRERGSPPQQSACGVVGELEMAMTALAELDALVNRCPVGREASHQLDLVAIAERAVVRWRSLAARRGRTLSLELPVGPMVAHGAPESLAAALDNLIANALEHGGSRITIALRRAEGGARVEVRDSGDGQRRRGRDPRRGHGLEVVERIAGEHGGSAALRIRRAATVASIELPPAPR